MASGLWPDAPGWGFKLLCLIIWKCPSVESPGLDAAKLPKELIKNTDPSPSTPHSNEAGLGLGTGCHIFNGCPSQF